MRCVLFVPGIMGTVLSTPDGEEVWPPTPLEVTFGYKRKQKLLREDLVGDASIGQSIELMTCLTRV